MYEGIRGALQKTKGKGRTYRPPQELCLSGASGSTPTRPEATKEEKELANTVHQQVSNHNEEVNLMMCKEVAYVASYCQVVQTPKKGFINVAFFQSEDNDKLMTAFDRMCRKIRSRQYDPPPPKPVNKDIRKWVNDQKEK